MGGCLVGGCLEVGGGGRGAAGEGEQQQEDDEACVPGNIDYYEEKNKTIEDECSSKEKVFLG